MKNYYHQKIAIKASVAKFIVTWILIPKKFEIIWFFKYFEFSLQKWLKNFDKKSSEARTSLNVFNI